MTRYVCGFRFMPDGYSVLLIEKQRPSWQRGKLNGVGGHIEKNEAPVVAMVREFKEETGLDTLPSHWTHTLTLKGDDWEVVFYMSIANMTGVRPTTMTDEPVRWVPIHALHELPLIYNLRWIIPMQLDETIVWPITIQGTNPH